MQSRYQVGKHPGGADDVAIGQHRSGSTECQRGRYWPLHSISVCDLTTVFSSGNVWNAETNTQPGRDSTTTWPRGDTASRWLGWKLWRTPRFSPSARISSWT